MRTNTKVPAFVALIAGLAMATPLFAHHGDAAYSATAKEMKNCVVTEFDWMNPHSLIKFDYKTATGETQHWTMEIGSPPSMALLGWSRTTLRAGDVITATFTSPRLGRAFGGRINKVILADGPPRQDDSTPSRYGAGIRPRSNDVVGHRPAMAGASTQ